MELDENWSFEGKNKGDINRMEIWEGLSKINK